MDRAEAFALAMHRDSLCPLCGRSLDECTSMEGEGPDFGSEYTACRATMARLEKERAISDGGKNPHPDSSAFLWRSTTRR
jgi:transcription initiation factor IIE alpha subunit